MLNQQMQQAVNANISTQEQQVAPAAPVEQPVEQPVVEQPQAVQPQQTFTQAQPQVQSFNPNWDVPQYQPAQQPFAQPQVEMPATDIPNTIAPEQEATTATEQTFEQQISAREEKLARLEALIGWQTEEAKPEEPQEEVKPEEPVINQEPESEEENLNYKAKWMEQTSRLSQLESENYRLQQQLKYANLELEDNATRYWSLKDRQIELNNSIESLRNKVTPDELADLSERYKVWTNANTDATSVQLVQSLCWLLTQVTWKDASGIFDDYLATRTNKDIPFTSHSDNSSINTSNNNRPTRLSL